MKETFMYRPKIERVIYWALYFKVIRSTAREVKKRQNDLWWGKEGDAPQGILKLTETKNSFFGL